jgi:hypothetical protein
MIALFHFSIHEELSVPSARFLVNGEYDDSGRFAVDAVERRQIINSGAASQSVQQAFVNITSPRCYRQEVRFAGDQNLVVPVDYAFSKRYDRLTAYAVSRVMGFELSSSTFPSKMRFSQISLVIAGNLLLKKQRIEGNGISVFGIVTTDWYCDIPILCFL